MKNLKILSFGFLMVLTISACKKDSKNGNCDTCNVAYTAQDIKATVDAQRVGKFNGLTYKYAKTGSTIKDGTKADFELTTDGKLTVKVEGQPCVTLGNPTFTSSQKTELQFKDNCKTMLIYAISFKTTGAFNEVNVASLTGTFYGQFQ